jgi:uncharacterized lipoprotein NlpE involved in copper resistance
MNDSKKVKIQIQRKDSKYSKVKQYVRAKYDYLASLGRLELGDREGLETEIQWRLVADMMEFMEEMEFSESRTNSNTNSKLTHLLVDND